MRVVYYLHDTGRLLISAGSLSRAYDIARSILGCFALLHGAVRDDDELLTEMTAVPRACWAEDRLIAALKDADVSAETALGTLQSGTGMSAYGLRSLRTYLPSIVDERRLYRCLSQFGLSRLLFYGHMSGSYYAIHYRHDRSQSSAETLRRQYFEHQERYELAFLAAFKALEAFFDVPQIKAQRIPDLFAASPFRNVTAATNYVRRHEHFRGFTASVRFDEMLQHFLTIRNATAAHANRTPPTRLMVTAETVYEIQLFVTALCRLALPGQDLAQLPRAAIVHRTGPLMKNLNGE